jgi:signal recognition particle receptor subunit beta
MSGIPLLIFANKQDLKICLDVEEIISSLELDKIKNRPWNILATSAKTRMGISEGFLWLKDCINLHNN